MKVYIDGQFVPKEDAKVSVFDHGLLYGDGVFEGIRSYGGAVFAMDEHVDRLYDSAAYISLTVPIEKTELKKAIEESLVVNSLNDDAYIRVVVTRGEGTLGLDPDKCTSPCVIIIADHIMLYPEEMYENGLEIVTAATRRHSPGALDVRVKSLNYLNNILAKIEGKNAGVIETLMLNHNGYVTECTGDNIFIIKDGVLKTPPENAGILKGITRGVVMGLARKSDMPVCEENLTRYDIFTADECFLTGTAAEIIPVVKLDRRTIGDGTPGPITIKLRTEFKEIVRR